MASAAAAVAATERAPRAGHASRIIAAALTLPGAVAAQTEPGSGLIAFRWLEYSDSQPGFDRIHVRAPSLALHLPVGNDWGIEATSTADRVSGASPRWHSAISSASRMEDRRLAGDVKVTRYLERSAWSLGAASSEEDDFTSKALSVGARWNSEDNNRSWTIRPGRHARPDRLQRQPLARRTPTHLGSHGRRHAGLDATRPGADHADTRAGPRFLQ
jgi:hypothetical protein